MLNGVGAFYLAFNIHHSKYFLCSEHLFFPDHRCVALLYGNNSIEQLTNGKAQPILNKPHPNPSPKERSFVTPDIFLFVSLIISIFLITKNHSSDYIVNTSSCLFKNSFSIRFAPGSTDSNSFNFS
jgi:hypothetical protein